MLYREIENQASLVDILTNANTIDHVAFQSLDFYPVEQLLEDIEFTQCLFLGCKLPESFEKVLKADNLIFPRLDIPFNPYTNRLYTRDDLFGGYVAGSPESYDLTLDKQVYDYYMRHGKEATDIRETLSRRLHDHAISDALYDFIDHYRDDKVVAMMGGHDLSRADSNYPEVARISKLLTERGYLMISGGGPGAMEATHLGAWFAFQDEALLMEAVKVLAEAPDYTHPLWLDKAFVVMRDFRGSGAESLGIPTWFYGHEPPSPFASRIAKYFENSIREDGLLAIAKGGVIFAPGNAGTVQEIFQDAAQNHYLSFGVASPMFFFNTSYWTEELPVYPMLKLLADRGKYKNLIISCHDDCEAIVEEIERFSIK
jgi:predicted Rossmann-fold nucleotide-binding protein